MLGSSQTHKRAIREMSQQPGPPDGMESVVPYARGTAVDRAGPENV